MTDALAAPRADELAPADAPQTIVVIGGGQAAGWILRTLRKEGFAGRLVMIADEPHLPYERPPLSKAVLAGEAGIDTVRLLAPDDFAALNVEAWQPDRAVSIDRAQQRVHTESGRSVEYDRLVIATGGSARRLPAALAATSHLAYLRTLDDAVALGARLRTSRRVVVVGGGWIGLEVAASARKLGVEASVIEGAPRLCDRSVPPVVSRFLLDLHRANGVDVHLDASLVSLTDHGDDAAQVRATLADGTTLDADFAIAGVGLEPHTAFARAAGLVVEDGVVVDAFGATSDPRVFACGDVASHPNAWLGRRVRLESWANAQNQAIATAQAMLGKRVPYADIPWFWSDQYDVNLQILGEVPTDAQFIVRGDLAGKRATLFHLAPGPSGEPDRGVVRGVIAINNPRELKLARKWMNQGRVVELDMLMDTTAALA